MQINSVRTKFETDFSRDNETNDWFYCLGGQELGH
jgi:hypothetical protein